MKKKIILILILTYILLFGVKNTYSLYTSNTNGEVELNFAKIIFNNEELDELNLPISNLIPGENIEYQFRISNNKDGVRSDITIGYNITVETYNIIPVTIILYDDSDETILECNDTNFDRNHQNKLVCSTKKFILDYKTDNSNNYKVAISFPEQDESGNTWGEDYSDLIDFIDIKIDSWQMVE